MNYQRIYASIVLRAQSECVERSNKRKAGFYYEVHHLIPKSLGGTNDKYNLAILTSKEHFICHWLLVKIYPVGHIGHNKMLYALWRMRSNPNGKNSFRYSNAKAYERYRTEYSKMIQTVMEKSQQGSKNSMYGVHWYTNANDGISIASDENLHYPWVRGRNLFRGECSILPNISALIQAYAEWDEFHRGNYTSLGEWGHSHNLTYQAIRKRFKRYIPIFDKLCKHGVSFKSNKALIGIYKMER